MRRCLQLFIVLTIVLSITQLNAQHISETGYYNSPGVASDVVVSGNYAFLADSESGLQIVDVSSSSNPQHIATYDTPGSAFGVAASNGIVYIADAAEGLHLLDVSDPSNPVLLGSIDTPGQAYRVVVSGNYAYIADGESGLQIVNIVDPENLAITATFDTPGTARNVHLENGYAYIADLGQGLQIADVSDPANPTAVSSIDLDYFTYSVAVSGNFAFLADDQGGMNVIDLTDIENPALTGQYANITQARDIQLVGDFAVIANRSEGFTVLNVSDPSTPELEEDFATNGFATAVFLNEGRIYIADGDGGLGIFTAPYYFGGEISVSTDQVIFPRVQGAISYTDYTIQIENTGTANLEISDISTDNHIYSSNFTNPVTLEPNELIEIILTFTPEEEGVSSGNLEIVSNDPVNSPYAVELLSNAIELIEEVSRVGFTDIAGNNRDLAISGDYAFIVDRDNGLHSLDISNPESPSEIDYLEITGEAYDIEVQGDYAFIAAHTDGGLRVVDISDPANLNEVASLATPDAAMTIDVDDNYAYVGAWTAGLRIIDISNPQSPQEVGFYDTPGYTRNLVVYNGLAYVCDSHMGLRIIDISNPEAPQETGSYNSPVQTNNVAISGDYAYVGERGTFRILDISNPVQPMQTASMDIPRIGTSVGVIGDYVLVGVADDGIVIFDTEDKYAPVEVDRHRTRSSAEGIRILGDYEYVADGPGGLTIYDISALRVPSAVYDRRFIDFGPLLIGQPSVTEAITVTNTGTADLVIENTQINGQWFFTNFDPPVTIEPMGSTQISVTFGPEVLGDFEGTLTVTTNDGENAEVSFDLEGSLLEVSLLGNNDTNGETWDVLAEGDYAYVADGTAGFKILDISSPDSPSILGSVDTPGIAIAVAKDGNFVFVADRTDGGLQIIDVSDVNNPQIVGAADTPGDAYDIDFANGYAFIADMDGDLRIFDVSDHTNPQETAVAEFNGDARGVFVSGNYAYVTVYLDGQSGLSVLDISDIQNPALAGSFNAYDDVYRLHVEGDRAYLANLNEGVRILDVSDLQNISEIGVIATSNVFDVVVIDDYAMLANLQDGFQVFDIADEANPDELVDIEASDRVQGIYADGNHIYVADALAGFSIYDASVFMFPSIEFSVDNIAFGELTVNTQATQEVIVTNSGNFSLSVDTPELSGEGFSIDTDQAFTLDPGESQTITVTFNPTEAISYSGTLTFASDAQINDEFPILLNGSGAEPSVTYLVFLGSYVDGQEGMLYQISPAGDRINQGAVYTVPAFDMNDYNLGDSFQAYIDAFSGTEITIEGGALTEDIEVHIILNNLSVTGADPPEFDALYSPDNTLQDQLWMFADFEVWTADPDSVQLNLDDDFNFGEGSRMVIDIPVDEDFNAMLALLNLDYDQFNASLWDDQVSNWTNNGIESTQYTIGEETRFRIALDHLSTVAGGPEAAFGGYTATWYVYLETYIHNVGEGDLISVTPHGQTVIEGEPFTLPAVDLAAYDLGQSFQTYYDGFTGVNLTFETGALEQDIEMHLVLKNLELEFNDPTALARITSPDENLNDQMWMYADLQVWTTDPDSVQLNVDEDYILPNGSELNLQVPLDQDFTDMLSGLGLDYDSYSAVFYDIVNEEWSDDGISTGIVTDGTSRFNIDLSHFSVVAGGGELTFPLTETIDLDENWNIVSLNQELVENEFATVFSDLVTANQIEFVKDMHGRFWWVEGDFANLFNWRSGQAYLVKMTEAADFTAYGPRIPETTSIPLRNGWSLVPYYPRVNVPAADAFANIAQELVAAKDENGAFYWPEFNFNNIPDLHVGEGYNVRTNAVVDLVWNTDIEEGIDRHPEYFAAAPEHFPSIKTGENMSILIEAGKKLAGYEVAAFMGNLCVGSGVIDPQGRSGLAVWGDDPTTEVIDGCTEGDALTFRIWDGELEFETNADWLVGEGTYKANDLTMLNLYKKEAVPLEFSLSSPYPNPFNASVKLRFSLTEPTNARLTVYDIHGREVAVLQNTHLEAGFHTTVWQADAMPTGIYIARLQGQGQTKTVKMTLVK